MLVLYNYLEPTTIGKILQIQGECMIPYKPISKFIPLLIFRTCDPIIQAAYKANGGQSGGAKEEDIADDL